MKFEKKIETFNPTAPPAGKALRLSPKWSQCESCDQISFLHRNFVTPSDYVPLKNTSNAYSGSARSGSHIPSVPSEYNTLIIIWSA